MAAIGMSSIVDIINMIGSVVGKPGNWRVSVDTHASGPVTHVAFGSAGATFEFTHGTDTVKMDARPAPSNHATVFVNNVEDTGAHVVVSHRHQLLKPVIVVVEFVDVTIGGAQHRVRFDCPR